MSRPAKLFSPAVAPCSCLKLRLATYFRLTFGRRSEWRRRFPPSLRWCSFPHSLLRDAILGSVAVLGTLLRSRATSGSRPATLRSDMRPKSLLLLEISRSCAWLVPAIGRVTISSDSRFGAQEQASQRPGSPSSTIRRGARLVGLALRRVGASEPAPWLTLLHHPSRGRAPCRTRAQRCARAVPRRRRAHAAGTGSPQTRQAKRVAADSGQAGRVRAARASSPAGGRAVPGTGPRTSRRLAARRSERGPRFLAGKAVNHVQQRHQLDSELVEG